MNRIQFSPSLIESIIAGRKTETRRLVKTNTKPKYEVGEVIYVGEGLVRNKHNGIEYEDGGLIPNSIWKWRLGTLSPMSMPGECARLFLRIVDVRVERLQDISEEDSVAEGMPSRIEAQKMAMVDKMGWDDAPVKWFRGVWDGIYGRDETKKWDANPEVFVYKFEVVEKP